jgi:hypothetical protein
MAQMSEDVTAEFESKRSARLYRRWNPKRYISDLSSDSLRVSKKLSEDRRSGVESVKLFAVKRNTVLRGFRIAIPKNFNSILLFCF